MAKMRKLSVTVDAKMLDDLRRLRPGVNISFLLNEALKDTLSRSRLKALLAEWEAEDPMTEEERRLGDEMWAEAQSFWTQARSPQSRKAPVQSAISSRASSKKKGK